MCTEPAWRAGTTGGEERTGTTTSGTADAWAAAGKSRGVEATPGSIGARGVGTDAPPHSRADCTGERVRGSLANGRGDCLRGDEAIFARGGLEPVWLFRHIYVTLSAKNTD